ncbi:protein kinase domain-containing protein [Cryptosporangium minutisporangium]|uniref:non-specific serine/threonine protein kinase n=1 Tax=Cryptosporangium minutisporangium TaxID=113569 RepID=A0ABP6SZM6_9ACTN
MTASVTLRVVRGRLRPDTYVFDERTTCLIGRAPVCSPQIPNDEHHRTISRHHCLLDLNPPHARIRDFGSLNGTYLNGRRIGRRKSGQTPEEAAAEDFPEHDLADGDEIQLGDTVFRVTIRPKPTLRMDSPEPDDQHGAAGPGVAATPDDAGARPDPRVVLERILRLAHRDGHLAPIAGYELLDELGRGGNGAVYLARRDGGSPIALKVMLPAVAADEETRRRFLREVEITRRLRHPHIAALYEAGTAEGGFYFTLEFCDGGSLDRLLARAGGTLPVPDAVGLALQALEGLEHAHAEGVVHRDLSPQNILLTRTGGGLVAKVADFGLAKAFDQAGLSGLTRTGSFAGKPVYLPRQQMINFRDARPVVDVWALAACLYHALTGDYPRDFPPGRDPWLVVLQDAAVPIRDRDPGIPAAVADVIDEALREDPEPGITTAAALRQALRAALR